jgi:hypothetical protein
MTGGKAHPIVAPPWVFYSSPFCVKGLWIRAPLCTAQVACSYEACGSKRWEPCKHVHPLVENAPARYVPWAHQVRRDAAKAMPSAGLEIIVRGVGENPGPPGGGYKISLALPPTVSTDRGHLGAANANL